MASPIAIAIQHCTDQYSYPPTPPYTDTRYRFTAVVQGISERPSTTTPEWDATKTYILGDVVKGSNLLKYAALGPVAAGQNPVEDFNEVKWAPVRVSEFTHDFELFLMQRTADAETPPAKEKVSRSFYFGLAYPPTFQLVEPTRYGVTAQKLWSELLKSTTPSPVLGEVLPWDPFKRQEAPAKLDVEANNVERYYTSRALVRESVDLAQIEAFKTALLNDIELFVTWYNNGVSGNWTTMNDVTIPDGWVTSAVSN